MNLNSKLGLAAILLASIAFAKSSNIEGTISLQGKSKSEYSGLAKVTLQEAIASATKGTEKVLEAGLEKVNGFLVYEIETQAADRTKKEVVVDAGSGKILDVKAHGDDEDDEDND